MSKCICVGCRFADWVRTSNGRLHPSGLGKCTWSKTFRIAPTSANNLKTSVDFKGGCIDRKDDGFKECPVFQRGSE